MNLACLDAHYSDDEARTACLVFSDWADELEQAACIDVRQGVSAYQSGQFYRRELPGLLAVLEQLPSLPDLLIVDGLVWLNHEGDRPGLGARLHQEIQRPVVGIAKTRFATPGGAIVGVCRGASRTPLYVSAVGLALEEAVAGLTRMHGDYRIPTLLKRVDHLARGVQVKGSHRPC